MSSVSVSPFTTVVEDERIFEVRKDGFHKATVGLGPDSPKQVEVPLTPLPREEIDAAALGVLDSPVVNSF